MTTPEREDDILGLIDEYLHGLLDTREHAYVEQRIRESRIWAAAYDEAKRRYDLLRAAPALEPDDALIQTTLEAVRQRGPRRQRQRRLIGWSGVAAAAAIVAILVSVNFYFSRLAPSPYNLEVLGQNSLLAGSDASLRVRLTRPGTGAGIADSTVDVALRDDRSGATLHLASFVTDEAGTGSPRVTLPDWEAGTYSLTISAGTARGVERLTQDVELRRDWRVLLSTDKPVYQPGQTIRLRTFGLRTSDNRPIAGEPVTFEINDPKGNLIFREKGVTSEFGITAADCPLADLIGEGTYQIRCRIGNSEAQRSVEVKRYVLPKFRVAVELDRTFYGPGAEVVGTIEAAYFFGQPVADGEAEIQVRSEQIEAAAFKEAQLVRLDEQGRGVFRVRLPGELLGTQRESGDAAIDVTVTVRDAAEQQVSRTLRRLVTAEPLRLALVPESGKVVPGVENEIFVFTTAADGAPVDARVSIEGLRQDLQTGDHGLASFTLRPETSEDVQLNVWATDPTGLVVNQRFTLAADGSSRAFVLRTDAASYDAGDSVHLSVHGGGSDPVFIDLIRNGQTILTQRVQVDGGQGVGVIDLPVDTSGALRLVAYRFDENGWPVRRERTIVVRPATELQVAVEGAATSHRPGESANLTFRVTDAAGRPAPGALSLAIVDEAVFHVLSEADSLAGQFQALDKELLEPIYAVYPWDPFQTQGEAADKELQRAVAALSARAPLDGRQALRQALLDYGYVEEEVGYLMEPERLALALDELDPETAQRLEQIIAGSGVYSLRAASFPMKVREVEQRQADWQRARTAILRTIAGLVVIGVVIAIIVGLVNVLGRESAATLLVLSLVLIILIAMLLPALGRARCSARGVRDGAILNSLIRSPEVFSVGIFEHVGSAEPALRVRQWFPETLLWRPQLVTDDAGLVRLDVPLADSITNWKITGGAITTAGQLGSVDADLVVSQPFFVDINAPVALTRGDIVELPIVVYNYLDQPQSVNLTVEPSSWFELLDTPEKTIALQSGEVARASFRIRASEIGAGDFEVQARGVDAAGQQVADAVRRRLKVEPEGELQERIFNGVLRDSTAVDVAFPVAAIEGSEQVILKLYPSAFSQVLEGLDGIFTRPYGCFEQTSSTTYPNLLALDYLRRTDASMPEVEAKALQYIHLGYQRLLSFEVKGGGFDWFGRPPANRTLTAYGLMEFQDLALVRDVDPALIQRTRAWLLNQQNGDGSWSAESHAMHDDPARRGAHDPRLLTTAYIAWAVFGSTDHGDDHAERLAARYLREAALEAVEDPYTLALLSLALQATGEEEASSRCAVQLAEQVRTERDADIAWWDRGRADTRTMFYGAGASASVETTALAALALMETGREPRLVRSALAWLGEQRDSRGTWGTTQATVLALKALVRGAAAPLGSDRERIVEIDLDGQPLRRVAIPPDQADVMQLLDLTGSLGSAASGALALRDASDSATGYQVTLRHHEQASPATPSQPLDIEIDYSKTQMRVGDWIIATARVENRSADTMPMIILDLPLPAGFVCDPADFALLAKEGRIERYEVTARSVIVYLRQLTPADPLEIRYRLRPTMPVRIDAPGASASEYYQPEQRATSPRTALEAIS